MTEELSVYSSTLISKEYRGVPVITLDDVDELHQKPPGTASQNFHDNKERFINGTDFFNLTAESSASMNFKERSSPFDLILLTEMGYLMLAKTFTDTLAWDIQRQLLIYYFRLKELRPSTLPDALPQKVKEKSYPQSFELQALWNIEEICGYLRFSKPYFYKIRSQIPTFKTGNRRVAFAKDVMAWAEHQKNKQNSSGDWTDEEWA